MKNRDTMSWLNRFQQNKFWKDYRFKKLNSGYPRFDFPIELIDEVEIEDFLLAEDSRIPLFVGSQFGVHPNPEETFKNTGNSILVAKLDKSLLSGQCFWIKYLQL